MPVQYDNPELLESFMEEFFDFDGLLSIDFFTEAMRGDYQAQANRVCQFFGFDTVYEYGAFEGRAHLSTGSGSFEIYEVTNIYKD